MATGKKILNLGFGAPVDGFSSLSGEWLNVGGHYYGFGNQSPALDAETSLATEGDFRFYIGTDTSIIGWRCTTAGNPGTWVEIDASPSGSSSLITFDNITALRAYSGPATTGTLFRTRGYVTANDGGAGFYYADSSVSADDGVLTFVGVSKFRFLNVSSDKMIRSSQCGVAVGPAALSFDPTGAVSWGTELERVTKLLSRAGYAGITFDPNGNYTSNGQEQVCQRPEYVGFILDGQGSNLSSNPAQLPSGGGISFAVRAAGDTGTFPSTLFIGGYITDTATTAQRSWTQTFTGAELTMTGLSNVGSHGTVPAMDVGQVCLLRIGACPTDANGWSSNQYFARILSIAGGNVTFQAPLPELPFPTAGINVSRIPTKHDLAIIDTNGFQDNLTIRGFNLSTVQLAGQFDRNAVLDCFFKTCHFGINSTGSFNPTYYASADECVGYNQSVPNPWYGEFITLQGTHGVSIPILECQNLDGVGLLGEELNCEGTQIGNLDVVWSARRANGAALAIVHSDGNNLIKVDKMTLRGGYFNCSISDHCDIGSLDIRSSQTASSYTIDVSKCRRLSYTGTLDTVPRSYSGTHSYDWALPYPPNAGGVALFNMPMMGMTRRLRLRASDLTNLGSVIIRAVGHGDVDVTALFAGHAGEWININAANTPTVTFPDYFGINQIQLQVTAAGGGPMTPGGFMAVELEVFVPDSDNAGNVVTGDNSVPRKIVGSGRPLAQASFIGQEYLDSTTPTGRLYKSITAGNGANDWLLDGGANHGDTAGRLGIEELIDEQVLASVSSWVTSFPAGKYSRLRFRIRADGGAVGSVNLLLAGLTLGTYQSNTVYVSTPAGPAPGNLATASWSAGTGVPPWEIRGEIDIETGGYRYMESRWTLYNGGGGGSPIAYWMQGVLNNTTEDVIGLVAVMSGGVFSGTCKLWGLPS